MRGLFTPQLSSLSGDNLSKQEINLKDKRKEKFVNSRQCQQRGDGEEIFKSNRWDFHLIDIVLKINYVVYANLTEAVSLLPFHVSSPLSLGPKPSVGFVRRQNSASYSEIIKEIIKAGERSRRIDVEGHVLSGWFGEDFFLFFLFLSQNDEMW